MSASVSEEAKKSLEVAQEAINNNDLAKVLYITYFAYSFNLSMICF